MKTAKEIIKLILVIISIVWLCSCGNKSQLKQELSRTRFDIELLAGELQHIDSEMNSYRFVDNMMFSKNNLSSKQLEIKRQAAEDARKEYEELSGIRTRVFAKMVMLKVRYDSLQNELDK